MSAPAPATDRSPAAARPRQSSAWIRRYIAEVVRGRHVILHGNVHDTVMWDSQFIPLRDALVDVLGILGFGLIAMYDQVDGLTGAGDTVERAHRLRQAGAVEPPARTEPARPADPDADRAARAAARRQRMAEAVADGAQQVPQLVNPQQALPEIRRILAQSYEQAAVVMDFAELLLLDPEHNDRPDRELLALVKKTMMEAAEAGARPLARNQLTLIAPELGDVPSWLYRREPFVVPVEIPRPTFGERHVYLRRDATRFFRTREAVDERALDDSLRTLANLSEGMTAYDLLGLRRTSVLEKIPLTDPRELINRAVFGQREDPWTRLSGHTADAAARLRERVIGQPNAVERVARTLMTATTGLGFEADPYSLEARPKGVFFFTGPTGTGKTELAKALAQLIFEDERAMIRFDMSSFAESHAAERLAGAPPGFVGHERGGELTNAVAARPFSLLLFDEIDKAHPAVLDKFLQILEDGRLTDGLGRTTYFSRTLIVFTSNIGADQVSGLLGGGMLPEYAQVEEVFTRAVREHFDRIQRPELLGRIGNGVIAFDILRPENVRAIARKFLSQLRASARRGNVVVDIDDESVLAAVAEEMRRPEALALGGRRIRPALERLVLEPLSEAIERAGARSGTFHIAVDQTGATRVSRRGEA